MIGHIIRGAVAWGTIEHSWMTWQPRLISSVGGGGKLLIFDRLEWAQLTVWWRVFWRIELEDNRSKYGILRKGVGI